MFLAVHLQNISNSSYKKWVGGLKRPVYTRKFRNKKASTKRREIENEKDQKREE
jgi:hypothetical protein